MKPILFNTEMVKAILDGRKTVTRRIMKLQPFISCEGLENECRHEKGFFDTGGNDWACRRSGCGITPNGRSIYHAPYQSGDVIYVRETWLLGDGCGGEQYYYKANETDYSKELRIAYGYKWHPSIHMPKEAARIFLKVKEARVEKLHDMTDKDAKREGIVVETNNSGLMHKIKFADLWDMTVKKADIDVYGWEANPWVWVIEFERISKEEALNQSSTASSPHQK